MGIFRSETMCSGTLVLPVEKARHFVDVLGSSANLMFVDLHSNSVAPHRPYRKYIQRIEEIEREIRFLIEKVKQMDLTIYQNDYEGFLTTRSNSYKLDQVEADVNRVFQNISVLDSNKQQMVEARNASIEEKYVLESASMALFQTQSLVHGGGPAGGSESSSRRSNDPMTLGHEVADLDANLIMPSPPTGNTSVRQIQIDMEFQETQNLVLGRDDVAFGGGSSTMFNNAAGVINQIDQDRFARFIFRSTRGNAFTHFREISHPIVDPKTGLDSQKSVFVIYYQGNYQSMMHQRIIKACHQFGANIYPWISSAAEARERLRAIIQAGNEKERALMASERLLKDEILHILEQTQQGSYNSLLEDWRLFLLKEKGIYSILNMCEGEGPTLRAQVWYPSFEEDFVRRILINESRTTQVSAMLITDRIKPGNGGSSAGDHGSGDAHGVVGSDSRKPPTYFRTNEFLYPFQRLIDEYGVPRYQEMTPVFFTIITFPFLFGVMFGDIGHGLMLMGIGLAIEYHADVMRYKYSDIFSFRYLIIMMGFFATYAGIMYNDFFSLGVNLFGSRWKLEASSHGEEHRYVPNFDPLNKGAKTVYLGVGKVYPVEYDGPYPFGVDPVWKGAQNELNFMNSMKMKLSVCLGVAQMILGLMMRLSNCIFERNKVDFLFEWVPMMVFMLAFFGYMDYMILYKWVTPMEAPPSIINTLICMTMGTKNDMPLYPTAGETQAHLLKLMVYAVPLMLIPKPLILYIMARRAKKAHIRGQSFLPLNDETPHEVSKPSFDFSECCIHQVIETIEFVLGSVSHTASYLRLWALSLAHQQLSAVFFKVLGNALASDQNILFKAINIYISFAAWMVITVGIFLGMDVMECFMHTLRLHWVEYQSKFFRADGYAFAPFRHVKVLQGAGVQ